MPHVIVIALSRVYSFVKTADSRVFRHFIDFEIILISTFKYNFLKKSSQKDTFSVMKGNWNFCRMPLIFCIYRQVLIKCLAMAEFFGLGAVPFDIGRQPMKQWHIS